MIGYRLQAKDGEMGHLRDVLISDTKWMVRYLLVDTRTWLTGKKVVIAPDWVDKIAWMESKVYLDLTKEDIKTSPDYISEGMLQRNMQAELARQVGSRQGR